MDMAACRGVVVVASAAAALSAPKAPLFRFNEVQLFASGPAGADSSPLRKGRRFESNARRISRGVVAAMIEEKAPGVAIPDPEAGGSGHCNHWQRRRRLVLWRATCALRTGRTCVGEP